MELRGTYTAMITPFRDERLDEEGFIQNLHFQKEQGVDGVVLFGSTGEWPTLSDKERERLTLLAVHEAKGEIPIIINAGSNCTRTSIENVKKAQDLGADGAVLVCPYYNKPTQEGLFRHFESISQNTHLPLIIYNIQGRTGLNIETPTLKRIADLPNVIGVKDSSGNFQQITEVISQIARDKPDFILLSGDDIFTLPIIALGGKGVISVASNLIPGLVCENVEAALKGQMKQAQELHYRLLPLYRALFLETNPVPLKAAMNLCGLPAGPCRLPLCELSETNQRRLENALADLGLVQCVK